MGKGKYYNSKMDEHNYSTALQKCIEKACHSCIETTFSENPEKIIEKKNNLL
jgi:hypothetical protein